MAQKQSKFDYPLYVAVRIVVAAIQAAPMESLERLADAVAWLLADGLKVRKKILRENIEHAFPDHTAEQRQDLIRRHWRYLFLMICEITHTPRKLHETNWRRHLRLPNSRTLVASLLEDRPTVVVSGHYGNFEIAGYTIGFLGFRSFSIARPLDNRYLNDFINQFRMSTRRVILPKHGSANEVAERLARNEAVTLLGDQSAGPKGCWVEFFNRPASAHKAIAVFSLLNDGPMIVCYGRQLPGPMQFEIGAEAIADPRSEAPEVGGVRQLTQWYTDRLADIIRVAPEQYWWVHNRWKGWDQQKQRKRSQAA
ncbi:MAG: lysophospholipid acyltransferase family protein [Pirellulales bacterium]